MQLENRLIGGDGFGGVLDFLPWSGWPDPWRSAGAEFHQARHQQETRLGRSQIRAADENRMRLGKALVAAAPDTDDRQAGKDGARR